MKTRPVRVIDQAREVLTNWRRGLALIRSADAAIIEEIRELLEEIDREATEGTS